MAIDPTGGQRLAAAIDAAGLSQLELARRITPEGVAGREAKVKRAREDINKMVNANRPIGPTWAKRMAPHLNVEASELLTPKSDPAAQVTLTDLSARLEELEERVRHIVLINEEGFAALAAGIARIEQRLVAQGGQGRRRKTS